MGTGQVPPVTTVTTGVTSTSNDLSPVMTVAQQPPQYSRGGQESRPGRCWCELLTETGELGLPNGLIWNWSSDEWDLEISALAVMP